LSAVKKPHMKNRAVIRAIACLFPEGLSVTTPATLAFAVAIEFHTLPSPHPTEKEPHPAVAY
jgi:hypothetical protein